MEQNENSLYDNFHEDKKDFEQQIRIDNPEFDDPEFQAYLEELRKSKEIKERLYAEDEPYDVAVDE